MEQSPVRLTSFQNLATEKESKGVPGWELPDPGARGPAEHPRPGGCPLAQAPMLETDASFKILVLAKMASRQVNCFAKGPFLSRVGRE